MIELKRSPTPSPMSPPAATCRHGGRIAHLRDQRSGSLKPCWHAPRVGVGPECEDEVGEAGAEESGGRDLVRHLARVRVRLRDRARARIRVRVRVRGRDRVRHLARAEGSETARHVVALRRGPHGVLRQARRPRHARSCRAERPLEAGPLGGALRADGEGGGHVLLRRHLLPRHRAESDGSRSQLEQYELAGCGGQLGKKELELGLERGPQPRSQRATVAAEPQQAERHEERHPADVFTGVGERVRQRQRVHGGVSPEQRTRRWLYVVGCARAPGSRRVRRARGRELYQHSALWARGKHS